MAKNDGQLPLSSQDDRQNANYAFVQLLQQNKQYQQEQYGIPPIPIPREICKRKN